VVGYVAQGHAKMLAVAPMCEMMEGMKVVGDLLKSLSEMLAFAGSRNANVFQGRQ
jgi:hypothetical protein